MAEFCLKCFNDINGTSYTEKEVWLEDDLCEGCNDIRPCVMELRPKPLFLRFMDKIKRTATKDKFQCPRE